MRAKAFHLAGETAAATCGCDTGARSVPSACVGRSRADEDDGTEAETDVDRAGRRRERAVVGAGECGPRLGTGRLGVEPPGNNTPAIEVLVLIRDTNMISHAEMMSFAGGRRQAGDRPCQGCAKVIKLTEMVLFGKEVITFGRSRSPVLWGAGDMPAFLGFDVESVVGSAIRYVGHEAFEWPEQDIVPVGPEVEPLVLDASTRHGRTTMPSASPSNSPARWCAVGAAGATHFVETTHQPPHEAARGEPPHTAGKSPGRTDEAGVDPQ